MLCNVDGLQVVHKGCETRIGHILSCAWLLQRIVLYAMENL